MERPAAAPRSSARPSTIVAPPPARRPASHGARRAPAGRGKARSRCRRAVGALVVLASILGCWAYLFLQLAADRRPNRDGLGALGRARLRATARGAGARADDTTRSDPSSAEAVLLTTPDLCRATSDVRGNLGPAGVVLTNGTDWLKDRWQAASDMGGTAIRGPHWVRLDFDRPVVVVSARLDWETAYSDRYELQALEGDPASEEAGADAEPGASRHQRREDSWTALFSAPSDRIRVTRTGRSPGVTKAPMPLHVIHEFEVTAAAKPSAFSADAPPSLLPTRAVRLLVRGSATGWGVSLWRIELYGTLAP